MRRNAHRALADITERLHGVLADARSVLDRPLLVDDHDRVTLAFTRARHDAHTAIAQHDTSQLGAAAEALAAAEAARYAFALADDHARALACRGIYPGGIVLDRRGHDHVAAARASLELACQAGRPDVARAHQQRACDLVAAAGLFIPAPLRPTWHALGNRATCPAPDRTGRRRSTRAARGTACSPSWQHRYPLRPAAFGQAPFVPGALPRRDPGKVARAQPLISV
jgi:hypothetical protein